MLVSILAAFALVALVPAGPQSTVIAHGKKPTNTPTPIPPTPVPGCGSLQTLINNAASGSTLLLPACNYFETVTINKPLTLDGQHQATLFGSDVWSGWTLSGGLYVSTLTVPALTVGTVPCGTNPNCNWPEQVYIDGTPQTQVAPGTTPSAGQWSMVSSSDRHVRLPSNPAGHTVQVTTRDKWVSMQADNVTVKNMTFWHCGNVANDGPCLGNEGHNGITIDGNSLSYGHGIIVSIGFSTAPNNVGTQTRITNNTIAGAGQLGIGGTNVDNAVIQGNQIFDTNLSGFDAGFGAGGIKLTEMRNFLVDTNTVYNARNGGAGIWCDIHCNGVTISNNRVHNVDSNPLFFEISGNGTIHDNVVWDSGTWGSPNVATSDHVNVYGNFVARSYSIHAALEGGTYLDPVCNCHIRTDPFIAPGHADTEAGSYLTFHDNQCVAPIDGTCSSFQNLTDGAFSASLYNNSDTNNVTLTGQEAIDALNAHGVPQ